MTGSRVKRWPPSGFSCIDRSPDATWYLTDAVGIGVTRGNVILAWGNPRELRAQVDQGGASYVTALPSPVQKRFAGGQLAYGFADPARAATFLAGHPAGRELTDEMLSAAKAIGGVDASFTASVEAWTVDAIVYAPEQGFSAALRQHVTRLAPELQVAARRAANELARRNRDTYP